MFYAITNIVESGVKHHNPNPYPSKYSSLKRDIWFVYINIKAGQVFIYLSTDLRMFALVLLQLLFLFLKQPFVDSDMTDITSGAGTSNPFLTHEFTPIFRRARIAQSLVFCVVLCRSLFLSLLCIGCSSSPCGFWLQFLISSNLCRQCSSVSFLSPALS